MNIVKEGLSARVISERPDACRRMERQGRLWNVGNGFAREQMNRIQNHLEGGIGSVYDRHHYGDEFRQIQEAVAGRIMAMVKGKEMPSKVVSIRAG